MSAEPIRKKMIFDTNLAIVRLCYNGVLDENIYSLFALFDLQANQTEKQSVINKIYQ